MIEDYVVGLHQVSSYSQDLFLCVYVFMHSNNSSNKCFVAFCSLANARMVQANSMRSANVTISKEINPFDANYYFSSGEREINVT